MSNINIYEDTGAKDTAMQGVKGTKFLTYQCKC